MNLRSVSLFIAALLCLLLLGCASFLPVPGGSSASNFNFYKSGSELKSLLSEVSEGMPEQEIFLRLKHKKEDFTELTSSEIIQAVFGGENVPLPDNFKNGLSTFEFVQSLKGYRLVFKKVKRKHGFYSPIGIQTDQKGFDYCLILIFQNGKLFGKPILTGGIVNDTNRTNIFDYFNIGLLLRPIE